jgi:Lhr-like helicase
MSLAHTRKPISVIGHIVILVITVVAVYLLITTIANYQVNKISKVYDKYLVTRSDLIPDEYGSYIAELKAIGTDKTQALIDYIYLYQEAKGLDRAVRYAATESGCITRTTIARIETQMQNRDKVLEEFNTTYSKKLDKIYWNTYIEILENKYDIESLKEKATALPFC